jgi:hypothetical protein
MNINIDRTIARAIVRYLAAQIASGQEARAFVRLEGFSEATYQHLLTDLSARGYRIEGRSLMVRSAGPIQGFASLAMEPDRSATWYRNTLPAGHTLLIILNRRTSDAQSLQDLYGISEQSLTRDGLGHLIAASFEEYQLEPAQCRTLVTFVHRLPRLRLEPQLRDLAEFLCLVDKRMDERPGTTIAQAIAESLPALNLFRCRELAAHLNTPRGEKLTRTLKEAVQVGSEVLEDRARQEYLKRLEQATLADDQAFGGLSTEEKRRLLGRFIDGALGDQRSDLLKVLSIDWHEVQQIITTRTRTTKPERNIKLADRLAVAFGQAGVEDEDVQEVLEKLREGEEPESEVVERVLAEAGELLGKGPRNDLRRLVRQRTRRTSDFLVGLLTVAIDLLHTRQDELTPDSKLRVTLAPGALERRQKLHDAAEVFRALYGGLERALPAFEWRIEQLWALAANDSEAPEEGEERERVSCEEIAFRVTLVGAGDAETAAELAWQYRSDSPAAATAAALASEAGRLADPAARPQVPIFRAKAPAEEIGDIDLRSPVASLGAWYEAPGSLRAVLERQLKPAARAQAWAPLDAALATLEDAWAAFVADGQRGLLGADPSTLLRAYETLLATAQARLTTGSEVGAAYRLVNQAWLIGPPGSATWAVVPPLHPLKLLWWRERARLFNGLVARLLDPAAPAPIVDVRRFQQELAATYGSSSFPPILALPPAEGRPAERFLPIEEAEGYELYFHEAASAEAFGLDTDLLAEDENELAALRAVEGVVAVVQDYIETYPFVRDGVEIMLFECRNGALPGMLIEQLTKAGQRRGWSVRLSVVVHTRERGASLFRRVSKWVAGGYPGAERQGQAYFPPITVKVLEAEPEELFDQQDDTDIVVLADVLAERGQEVRSELEPLHGDDAPAEGYLPTYRARQEPFLKGDQSRRILLSAPQQPTVARLFLLAQHAALDKRKQAPPAGHEARFYRDLTLDEWRPVIERLHDRFNWIVCYDTSIDRFLLRETFREKVQVIRYSLGLGAKRQHNLTVSSSGRAPAIVTRRLAARLGQMFPQAPPDFCHAVAEQLVAEAEQVSGDIVLRAAGPGAFLNELIGLVAAKFETERRYAEQHPGALSTWILLDDFEHWFERKFPDLLFVVIDHTSAGRLALHLEVLEAKCVGELSFADEAADAEEQVRHGIGRLAHAFRPGGQHLDALYWYDQLYRAVVGTISVDPDQHGLWELFRDQMHAGGFTLDLSGHTWAFCYDGQADVVDGAVERPFTPRNEDRPDTPLRAHHYGRNELAALLKALIGARGGPDVPAGALDQPPAPAGDPAAAPVGPGDSAGGAGAAAVTVAPPSPDALRPSTGKGPGGHAYAASAPQKADGGAAQPDPQPKAAAPVAAWSPADEQAWLKDKARQLERALRQRGVNLLPINPADADVGPSIVRFKLRLSGSETVRKLQNAAVDLARDLALIRTPFIDNVLGTNFVGVDLPRERAETVELLPLLRSLPHPGPGELPTIIGKTPDGKLHIEDLSEFPHLLVAGATGSGKSVFLRSVLLGLLTRYPPGKVELLIVDPKQTDFSFFDGIPYLRGGKVFTQPEEARDALLELVRSEMPRRQQLMRGRSMKVKDFNQRFPAEALPPIVALIDEYAQLLSIQAKKDADSFERDLMSLAAVARSTGIHLILATQRPSVNVVTGTLKHNLPTRVAFQVPTNMDSRVVLDAPGAENLLGRGDMLFRRASGETLRLQAGYMGEEQMQAYLAELLSTPQS